MNNNPIKIDCCIDRLLNRAIHSLSIVTAIQNKIVITIPVNLPITPNLTGYKTNTLTKEIAISFTLLGVIAMNQNYR